MGILGRLFGGNNNIIKDPDLGKVRYLESPHGNVWAGGLRSNHSEEVIEFFIESVEKVLKHNQKNILLDYLVDEDLLRTRIDTFVVSNNPSLSIDNFQIRFIHIPERTTDYDAQWICHAASTAFTVLLKDLDIVEISLHETDV